MRLPIARSNVPTIDGARVRCKCSFCMQVWRAALATSETEVALKAVHLPHPVDVANFTEQADIVRELNRHPQTLQCLHSKIVYIKESRSDVSVLLGLSAFELAEGAPPACLCHL